MSGPATTISWVCTGCASCSSAASSLSWPARIALRYTASRMVRDDVQRTTNVAKAVWGPAPAAAAPAPPPGPGLGPWPALPGAGCVCGAPLSPLPESASPLIQGASTCTLRTQGEPSSTLRTSLASHCWYGLDFHGSPPAHTIAASDRATQAERSALRKFSSISNGALACANAAGRIFAGMQIPRVRQPTIYPPACLDASVFALGNPEMLTASGPPYTCSTR